MRVATGRDLPGTHGHMGVRPEDRTLCASGEGVLSGRVRLFEHLGEVQLLHMTGPVDFIAKVPGVLAVDEGQAGAFGTAPKAVHLFDAAGSNCRNAQGEKAPVAGRG